MKLFGEITTYTRHETKDKCPMQIVVLCLCFFKLNQKCIIILDTTSILHNIPAHIL